MTKKTIPLFSPSDPTTWSPLLTLLQASQILNVSPWTLRQWDNKKKLLAVRIGTRQDRRYKKADLLKILDKGLK
ncbi:MAG: DNA-binding protein, excisionase family [Candidatus Woesebacteria bacterium GW2011_GWA1_37_8]|uniref:DNA-binding protein, excisionase family n=2 Tax=Candidatus Woeseibacteriota TaxID=1752722 RepID=A0A0G0L6X5_9BACT|nr:MAG: seg [Microgenomates group bacterium GW2011_GWC1_37_12b]KKQ46255.1 MAG: DNA-binding protein, excisionase family [Candidatus Woesebacteria bacterium GW2011_GWA1_37_8]KKQ87783.1 MAG: DNA-binding protein, excisionase family [Candidatus Woesebacteria bacterium GW2011_GWB1_38_8b]